MKIVKIIAVVLLVAFMGIQFVPTERNQSDVVPKTDFMLVNSVPDHIKSKLQTSCYDCHSNNTQYPWYSYIQPPRLIMENHIKKGKADLNFSEFGSYSKRKQENKLDRIVKQINADEMPLASYTMIHKDAILNTTQKEQIIMWINSTQNNNE